MQNNRSADIAVSTRVRFARNLRDFPFASRMTREQEAEVVQLVRNALSFAEGMKLQYLDCGKASRLHLQLLTESHLISPEFARSDRTRGVVLSDDYTVSAMINEEDHVRLQVMLGGLDPRGALEKAERLERVLGEKLNLAFDERKGYLTECPTNLGTGLRVSVMLHLPALTESGNIEAVVNAASKLGIAIRGFYGEGSAPSGALYQLSNQYTLGVTEEEIADRVEEIVLRIIEEERKQRVGWSKMQADRLADRVMRARGTLTNALCMDTDEAMRLLSDLRLGKSLSILPDDHTSYDQLNKLLTDIQPATVASHTPDDRGDALARDKRRAEIIKSVLTNEKRA